jgi:Ca2+-binding RTX toxin-like protein
MSKCIRGLGLLSCLVVMIAMPVGGSYAQGPATCAGRVATLIGTPGDDQIVGTPGRDIIAGGMGNDEIWAKDGRDLVCGGVGADDLHAGKGADDRLRGGDGDDRIHSAAADDLGDRLRGGKGDDVLLSNARIRGATTSRLLIGGPGNDRLIALGYAEDHTMLGGPGDDVLAMNSRDPGVTSMDGGEGRDILRGGRGNATFFYLTGDGDDVHIRTQPDRSTETYIKYSYASGPVEVNLFRGYGQLIGSNTRDTFHGTDLPDLDFINLSGTSGDDRLTGRDMGRDFVEGVGGDDRLKGRAGDDFLLGEDGEDYLLGAAGDDVLDGGSGNDAGDGGTGVNTCTSVEDAVNCR